MHSIRINIHDKIDIFNKKWGSFCYPVERGIFGEIVTFNLNENNCLGEDARIHYDMLSVFRDIGHMSKILKYYK